MASPNSTTVIQYIYIRQGYTVFCVSVSVSVSTQSVGLNLRNEVLFAEKCIRLVREKLTLFPYGQDTLETLFYWLSDDRARFKSKSGFRRNVQKCNTYITQNGFTAERSDDVMALASKGIIHSSLLCCKFT